MMGSSHISEVVSLNLNLFKMAKNIGKCFEFELGEEVLSTNRMFCAKNRLPSFQDFSGSKENLSSDLETEVSSLRQTIKELEETRVRDQEEAINRDIERMNEFQEKEKNLRQEYEDLERKYNCVLWKLDSAQKENKSLVKQLKDLKMQHEQFDRVKECIGGDEKSLFLDVLSRYQNLENEFEAVKCKKDNKIKLYKKKLSHLETVLEQTIIERDRAMQEFEETINENRRKSPMRSPLRSIKNTRRNSNNHVQEISQMIVNLERSQAEYKQKYLNLQKSKSASFCEINRLHELLVINENKLKEARKLQENLLKRN